MDNIPLHESYISLGLFRDKQDGKRRVKRNFLYYSPVNITERVSPELLQSIIENLRVYRNYGETIKIVFVLLDNRYALNR